MKEKKMEKIFNNINELQKKIDNVRNELKKKIPDVGLNFTTSILLWNDDDFLIECKHGNPNKNKIYMVRYHNDQFHYKEIDHIFN